MWDTRDRDDAGADLELYQDFTRASRTRMVQPLWESCDIETGRFAGSLTPRWSIFQCGEKQNSEKWPFSRQPEAEVDAVGDAEYREGARDHDPAVKNRGLAITGNFPF